MIVQRRILARQRRQRRAPRTRQRSISHRCASCSAWKKGTRETEREYLSVKLDDPSFPASIYASLVKGEGDDAHTLIWSHRNGD